MNRVLKQILSLLLASAFLLAPCYVFAAYTGGELSDADREESAAERAEREARMKEMQDLLAAETYIVYRDKYGSVPNATQNVVVNASDYLVDETLTTATVLKTQENYPDSLGNTAPGMSIVIGETGTVSWEVEIPESGMYSVRFLYTSVAEFTDGVTTISGYGSSAERGLKVDGEFPFKESRYLQFPRTWQDDYKYDENGNRYFERDESSDSQLRPMKLQKPLWETVYAVDSTGYYMDPFVFYFTAGKHTLTLTEVQEPLILNKIELVPPTVLPTYEEVLKEYAANGYGVPSSIPTNDAYAYPKINAEYADYTSAQTVYATNDRTSAITDPQDAATFMLNTIGGEKWNTVGQWVEWTIEVPEAGLYYIVPRSIQNVYDGVYSSRAIYINGKIPFSEAGRLQFSYSNEWKLGPLCLPTEDPKAEPIPIKFYLEKGENIIRMNAVLGEMGEILAQTESVMNTMNGYYLEILKLTGSTPDTYRDYEFSKLMPEVLQGMLDLSKKLYAIADQLSAINGYTGEKVVTLQEVALLLETLGGDEYKIAENFSNLNDQVSALGNWITDTRNQPLQIDYILFVPAVDNLEDVVLPPAEATTWEGIVFEFKAFVVSFATDYNSMSQNAEDDITSEAVEVWMQTGRDQAQIIRSMVNDLFTANPVEINGKMERVPINLKLVAGGQLQAVLAGVGPDIDLQEGEDGVITWAIRNANIPLQELPGFQELCDKYFTKSALIPLTLYGKTYGLPYTQNFSVMFYREDVLADLGIDPPETWDDIYDIIPTLQNNNMQMAVPNGPAEYLYQRYASEENFRWGNLTTPNGENARDENGELLRDENGNPIPGLQYPNGINDEYGIGYQFENGYKPGALVDGAIYVMPDGTQFNLTYGMQVNLDGENALACFKQMCEYFTLYSFPRAFNFQNRFRTGEMPIGIQGYSLYGTLMVVAPELRGLWSFTVIPGTLNTNNDGSVSVNHRTSSTIGSLQMLRGCGESNEDPHRLRAWEFMKFWVGPDAQERYGNEILALLGASGRHATANLEALKSQPWPARDRKALEECFDWVMTTYNMPGGYISARYVGFAYNNAYNDGDAPIPALLQYIDQINAELTRKRKEFDLPTLDTYEDFDYAAYYKERYQVEAGRGAHILGTKDGEVPPSQMGESQVAGNVQP